MIYFIESILFKMLCTIHLSLCRLIGGLCILSDSPSLESSKNLHGRLLDSVSTSLISFNEYNKFKYQIKVFLSFISVIIFHSLTRNYVIHDYLITMLPITLKRNYRKWWIFFLFFPSFLFLIPSLLLIPPIDHSP